MKVERKVRSINKVSLDAHP